MQHRIIQLKTGIHKGKHVFEVNLGGAWKAMTQPCKTTKTCRDRRARWLNEREKERMTLIARQVMARPWKDVYIQVDFPCSMNSR